MNANASAMIYKGVVLSRIGAVGFDSSVLAIILFFANGLFGTTYVTGGVVPTNYTTTTTLSWFWYTVIVFVYFFVQEAYFSQTLGKRVVGLVVVDKAGQPVTVRAALIRNLLRFVDALPCFYLLGGLIMALKPERQRLGDLVAETMVVHRNAVPAFHQSTRSRRPARLAAMLCLGFLVVCMVIGYFTRPWQKIEEMRMTRDAFFHSGSVTDLQAGNPDWGFGTVDYPVQYREQMDDKTMACEGLIRMRFIPIVGWSYYGGGSNCHLIN